MWRWHCTTSAVGAQPLHPEAAALPWLVHSGRAAAWHGQALCEGCLDAGPLALAVLGDGLTCRAHCVKQLPRMHGWIHGRLLCMAGLACLAAARAPTREMVGLASPPLQRLFAFPT